VTSSTKNSPVLSARSQRTRHSTDLASDLLDYLQKQSQHSSKHSPLSNESFPTSDSLQRQKKRSKAALDLAPSRKYERERLGINVDVTPSGECQHEQPGHLRPASATTGSSCNLSSRRTLDELLSVNKFTDIHDKYCSRRGFISLDNKTSLKIESYSNRTYTPKSKIYTPLIVCNTDLSQSKNECNIIVGQSTEGDKPSLKMNVQSTIISKDNQTDLKDINQKDVKVTNESNLNVIDQPDSKITHLTVLDMQTSVIGINPLASDIDNDIRSKSNIDSDVEIFNQLSADEISNQKTNERSILDVESIHLNFRCNYNEAFVTKSASTSVLSTTPSNTDTVQLNDCQSKTLPRLSNKNTSTDNENSQDFDNESRIDTSFQYGRRSLRVSPLLLGHGCLRNDATADIVMPTVNREQLEAKELNTNVQKFKMTQLTSDRRHGLKSRLKHLSLVYSHSSADDNVPERRPQLSGAVPLESDCSDTFIGLPPFGLNSSTGHEEETYTSTSSKVLKNQDGETPMNSIISTGNYKNEPLLCLSSTGCNESSSMSIMCTVPPSNLDRDYEMDGALNLQNTPCDLREHEISNTISGQNDEFAGSSKTLMNENDVRTNVSLILKQIDGHNSMFLMPTKVGNNEVITNSDVKRASVVLALEDDNCSCALTKEKKSNDVVEVRMRRGRDVKTDVLSEVLYSDEGFESESQSDRNVSSERSSVCSGASDCYGSLTFDGFLTSSSKLDLNSVLMENLNVRSATSSTPSDALKCCVNLSLNESFTAAATLAPEVVMLCSTYILSPCLLNTPKSSIVSHKEATSNMLCAEALVIDKCNDTFPEEVDESVCSNSAFSFAHSMESIVYCQSLTSVELIDCDRESLGEGLVNRDLVRTCQPSLTDSDNEASASDCNNVDEKKDFDVCNKKKNYLQKTTEVSVSSVLKSPVKKSDPNDLISKVQSGFLVSKNSKSTSINVPIVDSVKVTPKKVITNVKDKNKALTNGNYHSSKDSSIRTSDMSLLSLRSSGATVSPTLNTGPIARLSNSVFVRGSNLRSTIAAPKFKTNKRLAHEQRAAVDKQKERSFAVVSPSDEWSSATTPSSDTPTSQPRMLQVGISSRERRNIAAKTSSSLSITNVSKKRITKLPNEVITGKAAPPASTKTNLNDTRTSSRGVTLTDTTSVAKRTTRPAHYTSCSSSTACVVAAAKGAASVSRPIRPRGPNTTVVRRTSRPRKVINNKPVESVKDCNDNGETGQLLQTPERSRPKGIFLK